MKRRWVMAERGRRWNYLEGNRILAFIQNRWDSWDSFEELGRRLPGRRMLNQYGQNFWDARRTVENEFNGR